MRVLLDTNVVLDVLLKRQPFVVEAIALWKACDEGQMVGYITASSLTDIFYIARRLTDATRARASVRICLDAFEVCPVDRVTLEHAERLPGGDFEDNLQMACATLAGLDAIVTRDPAGFKTSTISIVDPATLLAQLAQKR
jgi:predicted nucleic acid-binding protein